MATERARSIIDVPDHVRTGVDYRALLLGLGFSPEQATMGAIGFDAGHWTASRDLAYREAEGGRRGES